MRKSTVGVGIITLMIILIAATYFIVSGSNVVKFPDGLEVSLNTKINYADGTSDTATKKPRPGSITLFRNEKSVQNIVYTLYIKSSITREVNLTMVATGTDNTKNVILTKGLPSRQIIVTGDKVNKEIFLEPLIISSSDILNNIPIATAHTTTQLPSINLITTILINENKLESETTTFQFQEVQIPPSYTPPAGYTPYPTPIKPCRLPEGCDNSTAVRLVAVRISGG